MDKGIIKLFFKVIFIIVLVMLSVPIWNYSISKKNDVIANNSQMSKVKIELGKFEPLLIMDDKDYLIAAPTEVVIQNVGEAVAEFDYVFLIDKKSNINLDLINVSLDDKIYHLREVGKTEDDDNYYYVLERKTLDGNEKKTLNMRIWLSKSDEVIDMSSTLTMNVIIK